MKRIVFIFAILLALLFMANLGVAKPIATVDNPTYTFKSIPEGVHVDHDFIIRNTGDTQLNIEKVLPP